MRSQSHRRRGRRLLQLVVLGVALAAAGLALPGAARADNITNMTWHGGTIMPTSATYAIFWLPAGVHYEPTTGVPATDAANDLRYENLLIRYFNDVGGSDIYATTTQYNGSNGFITNSSTFGGSFIDTTAYPHAGTSGDPLTKQNLQDRVEAVRSAQGWPTGVSAEYFIFTGFGIQSCTPSGSCSTTEYCAYHSHYDSGSGEVVWANMPDAKSLASPSVCDDFNVNGDSYADVEITITSHEHLEAVTDPEPTLSGSTYGGGWYDDVDHFGGENGDKCAYDYGVENDIGANIYMNGNPYKVQREWNNAAGDGATAGRGCTMSYCPPDICLPVLTFSNNAAPGTIAGNPSDNVNVNLMTTDPSNAEPAKSTAIATTLPAGLTRTGGAQLTIVVGNVGVHDTRSYTTVVSPSAPLLDGTVLTVSSDLSYKDSLNRARPTITRTSTITVANAPPALVLSGPQTQDYHDSLTFGISATDVNAGDTLALSASGLPAGLTFTDNGNRTGTVSGVINDVPGVYVATFSVSDGHHLTPVTGTVTITVTREETTVVYTGPTLLAQNMSNTLTALLREDGVVPIAGRTVSIKVGTGGSSQSCSGVTNVAGVASCVINPLTVPQGPQPIATTFAGDVYYLPSSDSDTGIVFAYLDRGSFVLGDGTVAAATPATTVTFWGAQWSTLNSLSGGVGRASFKGFAATLSSSPPVCGGSWTTGPGNSPRPIDPSGLPAYMATAVASSVAQSGSTISGNIVKIVIVKTDPGYDSSPGHAGTGKIVATLCG